MDESKQPGVQIDQIIVLEAKFAHGKNALSLPPSTHIANLGFDLQAKVAGKPGQKNAVLGVRASTKDDPSNPYHIAVEVVMIVSAVPGHENLDPLEYVSTMGPAALYPFVREAVANLTLKGRFGPVWLKPYNFVAAGTAETRKQDQLSEPVANAG